MASTLAGLLAFHALARDLSGRPRLALGLTLLLAVSPATILYENKLYYEGVVAWWAVCGFALLGRHLRHGGLGTGIAAFATFVAVVLTRAAFHPA